MTDTYHGVPVQYEKGIPIDPLNPQCTNPDCHSRWNIQTGWLSDESLELRLCFMCGNKFTWKYIKIEDRVNDYWKNEAREWKIAIKQHLKELEKETKKETKKAKTKQTVQPKPAVTLDDFCKEEEV